MVRDHEDSTHSRSRKARGQGGVTAGRNPPMRKTQAPSGAFFIAKNTDTTSNRKKRTETEPDR